MSDTTLTLRVDEALKSAFAQAAKAQDRTAAQLLRDFMRDYVKQQAEAEQHERWFRSQVHQALASAEAGRLTPSDEVEALFAARREATRSKLPPAR